MIFSMNLKLNQTSRGMTIKIVAAVIIAAGLAFWMIHRAHAHQPMSQSAQDNLPATAVARIVREDMYREVTMPAEFRPYVEVTLHAKVSGFVNKMNVDFGDTVKAGQLLATLEVPELQAELASARAAEQKAEADHTNAHLIYMRLQAVNQNHPNLVAQQELDTSEADDQTTAATIAAAQADVTRYQTMVDYTHITAPFDGVVTHRYVDPGTLIQAGTSSDTQSLPLVRVSDLYRLRLDFPVTVDYVKDIQLDDPVEVRVDSLGGKTFTGKISRFTHDVSEDTRTMITEIEVPNPDLKLVPGMYATVVLKVDRHEKALAVPTEAIADSKKPVVYVIGHDDQIEERPVQIGLEMADKYEVISGLEEGDMVVIGNHAGLSAGERVEPKLVRLSMSGD